MRQENPLLTLRPGVSVDEARKAVEDVVQGLNSFQTRTTPSGVLDGYLVWVRTAEGTLRHFFTQPTVTDLLLTPAYWYLRDLKDRTTVDLIPQVIAVVREECERKQLLVAEFARDFGERIDTYRRTGLSAHDHPHLVRSAVVVDSSALVELENPWTLNWAALTGLQIVRLIVPLRVVEELDRVGYQRQATEAARFAARRHLRELEDLLDPWPSDAKQLTERLTVEILIDPGPRYRPEHADDEILQTCEDLNQFTGKKPLLVTSDGGMRFRSRYMRSPVMALPDELMARWIEQNVARGALSSEGHCWRYREGGGSKKDPPRPCDQRVTTEGFTTLRTDQRMAVWACDDHLDDIDEARPYNTPTDQM